MDSPPEKIKSEPRDWMLPPIEVSSGSSCSSSSSSGSSDVDESFFQDIQSKMRQKRAAITGIDDNLSLKIPKTEALGFELPFGFLKPLPRDGTPEELVTMTGEASFTVGEPVPVAVAVAAADNRLSQVSRGFKQFWKAGDYVGDKGNSHALPTVGMDHVRVHPRFLHSNATSHKWSLGAFAELLDNSLDEVCNGATYVSVDIVANMIDETQMLLVEDNGGGMNPDQMRQCMSLGYSEKSKMANTIGQYGNGFKTSTMRLGADVIVFSRCKGLGGNSPTQSIGMLSYTFLRDTGKEDIIVPMVDYEKKGKIWCKMNRSCTDDWNRNLETIMQWSPYGSEEDLLQQLNCLKDQGTRIVIYNLWEDDEGQLELDFEADPCDIQIRGINRDEKKIEMAKKFPNSRHFLTYHHSLRSYASILYLRLPANFRMLLRGKEVQHHNIVNNMMLIQEKTYKPMHIFGKPNSNIVATVTLGFVKDAQFHIDVQGFNVYHKNRLIKPFWRVWNAAGSDGRGVIGVLEANFVEPAHDKQSFERTTVLSRLEARLVIFQKSYWSTKCQEVGYAPRRHPKNLVSSNPEKITPPKGTHSPCLSQKGYGSGSENSNLKMSIKLEKRSQPDDSSEDGSYDKASMASTESEKDPTSLDRSYQMSRRSKTKAAIVDGNKQVSLSGKTEHVDKLRRENEDFEERLNETGGAVVSSEFHYQRCQSLESQLKQAEDQIMKLEAEKIELLQIISNEEECNRKVEEEMGKKLRDASKTIDELLEKVNRLESSETSNM